MSEESARPIYAPGISSGSGGSWQRSQRPSLVALRFDCYYFSMIEFDLGLCMDSLSLAVQVGTA